MKMTLKDRFLQWRKRMAIKRKDNAAYFRLVDKIAKREVQKLIKEKLKK